MNWTIPSALRVDARRVLLSVWVIQTALVALAGLSEYGVHVPVLRPVVAVLYLTFVPGTLVILALDLKLASITRAVLYAFGASLFVVMAVGGVMSLAYPSLGIERPISLWPLLGTSVVLVAALTVVVRSREFEYRFPLAPLFSPLPLALLLLPFVSVFGTYVYAQSGNNLPLLYMLGGIGLAPVVVAVRNRDSRWYGLAVWCMAMALLYHAGLWPFGGGHPEFAMTMEQGRWMPNAVKGRGSLLPNTVLFPVYAVLTGFTIEAEWTVVNPFLVSFLPVALYEVYRTQVDDSQALIATCIFMFAYPFYTLYPGAGRVATPVLFLALLGLVFTDEALSEARKALLTLAFGAGVVVSHYGTAYVVMFALLIGALVYLVLTRLDSAGARLRGWSGRVPGVRSDESLALSERARVNAFRPPFLAFYSTLAMAWYLYTAKGVKFRQLPAKISDAVYGVLYTQATGSATNVVTKEYGSEIVAQTRLFYILLGVLMFVGFIYALYRRVVTRDALTSDQYYALAAGHFAIFAGSALPSGTGFAVARVMMIIFTFAAPFALFGVDGIRSGLSRVAGVVSVSNPVSSRVSTTLFAGIVCVFLLMNSGVTAELVQKDFAPSKKVSTDRLVNSENPYERARAVECRECDINTHFWLYSNANQSIQAYGDEYVESQTDFYASEISVRSDFSPGPNYYTPIWSARTGVNETAFIVLLPRNIDTGGVYRTKSNWVSNEKLDELFERSHIVYRSQETVIYQTVGNGSS